MYTYEISGSRLDFFSISVWGFHINCRERWILRIVGGELFVFLFLIQLRQWLEIKGEKETSKDCWDSVIDIVFGVNSYFATHCLARQQIYFIWIWEPVWKKKNYIDSNSLKHKIVFIPSLEKLQGTFCLGNPFDSTLNTNGIPKPLGMFPLISYPETDFITIIAGLPGSWQLLPSKTLNSLTEDCWGAVVLSAGQWGTGLQRRKVLFPKAQQCPVTTQQCAPSALVLSRVACGSQSLSTPQQLLILANSYDTRHMKKTFSSLPFFFFFGKLLKVS